MEKDVILPTRAVWPDVQKGTLVPAQFLVLGSIPGAFGSDEGLLATDPNAGRNQSYSASSPLSGRIGGCSDGPHDTPS